MTIWKILLPIAAALFWCEYLVYFVTIGLLCQWPGESTVAPKDSRQSNDQCIYSMVLSDTHLLGNKRGHPLDKLRREWQMHMSFKTSLTLLQPNLIIILGDVFDEGLIASPQEFRQYTNRFHEVFPIHNHKVTVKSGNKVQSSPVKVIVAVGNHDIGFHDRMVALEPLLRRRFETAFNTTLVQEVQFGNEQFVIVNSMALEGDGEYCNVCSEASSRIEEISTKLKAKGSKRPVLLMHFPLYRINDENCYEADSAEGAERSTQFRPKLDCVSKESTDLLLKSLNPKLVLTGHTHNGCFKIHEPGHIPEYTVASFSWRNRRNPSFLVIKFCSGDTFSVGKCFLPNEHSVAFIYFVCLIITLIQLSVFFKETVTRIANSRADRKQPSIPQCLCHEARHLDNKAKSKSKSS